MDDIIYTLSAMRATGCRIRIRTIDIPTLSGPTSGTDMVNEFKEFWVQSERWTIGAAEVFHYFFVKLIKCNYFLPGLAYVSLLMCLLLFIMTCKHHFSHVIDAYFSLTVLVVRLLLRTHPVLLWYHGHIRSYHANCR
jgi:cellulose synthase/poly-beta-1,6-N-acetylglucosamine synthase-like glycosyltransferase